MAVSRGVSARGDEEEYTNDFKGFETLHELVLDCLGRGGAIIWQQGVFEVDHLVVWPKLVEELGRGVGVVVEDGDFGDHGVGLAGEESGRELRSVVVVMVMNNSQWCGG